MEEAPGTLESLIENVKAYIITTLKLTELKVVKSVTSAISALAALLTSVVLISILVIMISIGAGLWLGEILGKIYYGFFAVAGFYVIVIVLVRVFLQNWIKSLVGRSILKHLV